MQSELLNLGGLVSAALFSGAAVYIFVAEHPARMSLQEGQSLRQFANSYPRATKMQGGLAIAGGLFGALGWLAGAGNLTLLAATVLLLNWPYTIVAIMPTNRVLVAANAKNRPEGSGELLKKWEKLHRLRIFLGALATVLFAIETLT